MSLDDLHQNGSRVSTVVEEPDALNTDPNLSVRREIIRTNGGRAFMRTINEAGTDEFRCDQCGIAFNDANKLSLHRKKFCVGVQSVELDEDESPRTTARYPPQPISYRKPQAQPVEFQPVQSRPNPLPLTYYDSSRGRNTRTYGTGTEEMQPYIPSRREVRSTATETDDIAPYSVQPKRTRTFATTTNDMTHDQVVPNTQRSNYQPPQTPTFRHLNYNYVSPIHNASNPAPNPLNTTITPTRELDSILNKNNPHYDDQLSPFKTQSTINQLKYYKERKSVEQALKDLDDKNLRDKIRNRINSLNNLSTPIGSQQRARDNDSVFLPRDPYRTRTNYPFDDSKLAEKEALKSIYDNPANRALELGAYYDQSSNGNNNSQEASTNKQGDFLSLFENENAHDIDLAYLDSVVFDPLVKLNTINDNPRRLSALPSATQRQSPTKLNASSTNMNDRRYSSSLNLYSNPYTRAMELERERNELEDRIESLRYTNPNTTSYNPYGSRASLQPSSNLDSTLDTLREQQRVNQLALTMLRHRTINQPSFVGRSSRQSASLSRNPFSTLPSYLPPIEPHRSASSFSAAAPPATDYLPGLSGVNIYDPNLTADEIRMMRINYLHSGGHDQYILNRFTEMEYNARFRSVPTVLPPDNNPASNNLAHTKINLRHSSRDINGIINEEDDEDIKNKMKHLEINQRILEHKLTSLELTKKKEESANWITNNTSNTYTPKPTRKLSSSLDAPTRTRDGTIILNYDYSRLHPLYTGYGNGLNPNGFDNNSYPGNGSSNIQNSNQLPPNHYGEASNPTDSSLLPPAMPAVTNRNRLAQDDPMLNNGNQVERLRDLPPSPYDAVGGFILFVDFVMNLDPAYVSARVVTCLHHPKSGLGEPSVLPIIDTEETTLYNKNVSVAMISTKQPVPRCPAQQTLGVVVELQLAQKEPGTNDARLKSCAWAKLPLFDSKGRLLSGRWKTKLKNLPIKSDTPLTNMHEHSEYPFVEFFYRLVNLRDSEEQTNAPISPIYADQYTPASQY